MINVFVGLSKNQLASYENILDLNKKHNCKNVLIANKTLTFNSNLWDEVIISEKTFDNQSSSFLSSLKNIISKIKTYKEVVNQISKYKKVKEITLYFTYIEDVLTNYLLLSFNKNIKGIVVEDGTLNYYPHTIKSLSTKKVFLKWLISNVYGLRFKFYKGHSSGIEESNVLKQYVRVPELSMFPEKSEFLPYPKRETNLSKTILIIGQEGYIHQQGEEKYYKNLSDLFSLIKGNEDFNEVKNIYYKPHRHGKRICKDWLQKQFTNSKITYYDSNEPLEDLYFKNLGSKDIYSFDSSALLNIYLELAENLRDDVNFHVFLRYNNLLEPIFKKFNFRIYK